MSQDMINLMITISGAVFGWMLRVVWESIRKLQDEMNEFQREVHTSYVSKDDYRQDILEVKEILKQIFDKLDRKADK
jgi:antirestriction protein